MGFHSLPQNILFSDLNTTLVTEETSTRTGLTTRKVDAAVVGGVEEAEAVVEVEAGAGAEHRLVANSGLWPAGGATPSRNRSL